MDITELIKGAADNGLWALLAVFLIKYTMDDKAKTIAMLEKNHKESMEDVKSDKEKLMDIVVSQRDLLVQQKEILSRQTDMLSHNEEMLNGLKVAIDKMSDIQLLHANRLEKIEDRLERVERQTEK